MSLSEKSNKLVKVETRQCIYCLRERSFTHSRKGRGFTKEHVLHESFAKFDNTLTLIKSVCGDCNHALGVSIDQVLSRSTHEAVERVRTGLKTHEEFHCFSEKYLKFEAKSDDLKLDGAPLRVTVRDRRLGAEFVPQLVLELRDRKSWEHIRLPRLISGPIPSKADITGNWCILGQTDRELEYVRRLAEGLGIQTDWSRPLPPGPSMPVYCTYTIDDTIKRAIAKIAFNYLAYHCERLNIKLPLDRAFDPVRNYIGYDTRPGFEIVVPRNQAILALDTDTLRQTNGHMVTVEFLGNGNRCRIEGSVSLFNYLEWRVLLCRDYRGLIYPIHHGHHWSIDSKICTQMSGLKADGSLHVW